MHDVRVYANDTFGNPGASQQIDFNIILPTGIQPKLFPTMPVVAAIIFAVALVAIAGLFKRRRGMHNTNLPRRHYQAKYYNGKDFFIFHVVCHL